MQMQGMGARPDTGNGTRGSSGGWWVGEWDDRPQCAPVLLCSCAPVHVTCKVVPSVLILVRSGVRFCGECEDEDEDDHFEGFPGWMDGWMI